jgi:hypothetical protein
MQMSFNIHLVRKSNLRLVILDKFDPITQLIPLSLIPLNCDHCTTKMFGILEFFPLTVIYLSDRAWNSCGKQNQFPRNFYCNHCWREKDSFPRCKQCLFTFTFTLLLLLLYFAKTISAIFHFLYQIVENASSKPVNSCKETQLFLNRKNLIIKGLL